LAAKTNAAGASHPSRIVRGFLCCLCHRMAADDRFSPTAASLFRARHAAFCRSKLPIRNLATTNPQPLRPPEALFLLRAFIGQEQVGEEAATPGQPVALARVSGVSAADSPSRIAGCRWLCRNHPASSGMLTFR